MPARLMTRGSVAAGWWSRAQLVCRPCSAKRLSRSKSLRPGVRHTQPPSRWAPAILFPGLKWPEREVNWCEF